MVGSTKYKEEMKLNVKECAGQWIGAISGRLDTAAAAEFAREMQPLIDHADQPVVLDCSELEFISSSGLRLFLTLRKESIAKGGSVTVKGLNKEVKQVFALTGFLNLFTIED